MDTPIIYDDELASYLQVTIPEGKADFIIELANALVREVIGDLDPVPAVVRAITVEVAARGYRNPSGVTALTKNIEDWSKTQRWDSSVRGGVFLTDEERAALLAAVPYSLTPTRTGTIKLVVPGFPGVRRC